MADSGVGEACAASFAFVAQQLTRLAREGPPQGSVPAACWGEVLERLTRLPCRANELLGSEIVAAVGGSDNVAVFAAYVQAVLLNEKLFPTFSERERFFSVLAQACDEWALPLFDAMAVVASADVEDLLFRTFCVVFEAFPPVLDEPALRTATAVCEAGVRVVDRLDAPRASVLAVLELVLAKAPERLHATVSGAAGAGFWTALWHVFGEGSDDAQALAPLLAFVQRVVTTAEALTTDLLRMVLLDNRQHVMRALASPRRGVAVQGLALLQTLALCKHEVISDALIGSEYVDFVCTHLVADRPDASVLHQYVFTIVKCVLVHASAAMAERLLGGSLVGWLQTALLSVPAGSSARAYLLDLVVFIGAREEALARFLADQKWSTFAEPVLREAHESRPDPAFVAEMLAKKRPAGGPGGAGNGTAGPVHCSVCNVSLTAYYLIEGAVYCSDHRPAQCASCRCPLRTPEEFVQLGFLKYCKAHAPPTCVRCGKFISRYMTVPGEGIVCVDCGAPKCAKCLQPIIQGHCVTFRKERFHAACFVCGQCSRPLGEQFVLSGEERICITCGSVEAGKGSEADEDTDEGL